ncbi:UDP-2,3-diacylglucosamine diphosphatase [Pseudidiomarina aestuarii]|uniref:UDP-2,3-diacylglucosamine hydrolase n=1 Tax=Pseudidiomarina aestuarii TaxID=624146 RepID=A0A7Z6ZU80_9GAMM|nr:UDP-2,3-diacylglucosamine diphosphatase [Pseudidiomarina aestuarii]RUO41488.1 UDP-2,3-diacylglucosamine diphosphatase [Pseudidiomarina aestuarii]
MTTWFLSDLHLSPARPDISALAFKFFRTTARQADAIYILGDLVDAWIGDDDTSAFAQSLQHELGELTRSGVPTFFIAGNRDFLMGAAFSEKTGVTLLPEETVVDLYGVPTLLLHGDSLCTDDVRYQRFRRFIRHPWVSGALLALPLTVRLWIARKLRANSSSQQPLTPAQLSIMDVNDSTVRATFEGFGVQRMIHGHTHRPAIHQHVLKTGATAERIVLGDWYEQGSLLRVDANGYDLIYRPLTADTV